MMMKIKKGKLIIIVAPSGTGKSSLIQRLKKHFWQLEESVSFTTRPMRPGEKEGINYHYISREEFLIRRDSGDFVEWAEVHGNFYGTSNSFVHNGLERGHNLLFDLDVQGCDSFRKVFGKEARIIFIEPPSIEELEKRLIARGTESLEIIELRISNARREIERKNDFEFLVMNDDIERAYHDLKKIIHDILEGAL